MLLLEQDELTQAMCERVLRSCFTKVSRRLSLIVMVIGYM